MYMAAVRTANMDCSPVKVLICMSSSPYSCLTCLWYLCKALHKFFKWMKQHLRIKSFWGTSLNAVKTQIYCAIIAYCLVAIVGNKLNSGRSIYEILQILSISLLDKTPVREILTDYDYKDVKELKYNQL